MTIPTVPTFSDWMFELLDISTGTIRGEFMAANLVDIKGTNVSGVDSDRVERLEFALRTDCAAVEALHTYKLLILRIVPYGMAERAFYGLIIKPDTGYDARGTFSTKVMCVPLEYLLHSRRVYRYDGVTGKSVAVGVVGKPADDVLKHLVRHSALAGTVTDDPDGHSREWTNTDPADTPNWNWGTLAVEADASESADLVTDNYFDGYLDDVLNSLAQKYNVVWQLVPSISAGAMTFTFKTKLVAATDRSYGNGDGNKPVILTDIGGMIPTGGRYYDLAGVVTVLHARGMGGTARNEADMATLGRWEGQSDSVEPEDLAIEIEQYRPKEGYSDEFNTTTLNGVCHWMQEFFTGDKVTHGNNRLDVTPVAEVIEAVTWSFPKKRLKIEIRWGDKKPDSADKQKGGRYRRPLTDPPYYPRYDVPTYLGAANAEGTENPVGVPTMVRSKHVHKGVIQVGVVEVPPILGVFTFTSNDGTVTLTPNAGIGAVDFAVNEGAGCLWQRTTGTPNYLHQKHHGDDVMIYNDAEPDVWKIALYSNGQGHFEDFVHIEKSLYFLDDKTTHIRAEGEQWDVFCFATGLSNIDFHILGHHATGVIDAAINATGLTVLADVNAGHGFTVGGATPVVGHYLRSDGAHFVDGTIQVSDLPGHSLLSATHSDTLAGAVADGDIIIGNVTPKWSRLAISIPAANVRNVLGVDNGELRPSWKAALDATNPVTLTVSTVAAPGTSLVFAHRDHAHPITSSSNPGAAASILASDASGFLTLAKLTATSLVSATLTYAGNINLDATGAGTTIVYVKNSGAGVANLDVDGALIVAGATTLNALAYTWPAAAVANYYLKVSGAGPYTLSWVNPVTDHTHANDHAAVTLDAATHADDLLGLTGQLITLDSQVANIVFAGPASGGAAAPQFRALVEADIPADFLTATEHTAIGNGAPHHAAVTLGGGSDAALSLVGQVLTLADVLTPTEHTAIGDSSPHHAAVTLAAALSTNLLGLSTQQLTLPVRAMNLVFAGPVSGADAAPAFRALVEADIPAAFLTATEHTAIGDASPHHAAVTLDAATHADDILGLTAQLLTLDNQTANYVWAGPTSGAAAAPTFRALIDSDLGTGRAANYYLKTNGAGVQTWVDPATDHTHATAHVRLHAILDSADHNDTLTGTVTDGDVIIGNVTPKWSRLAISIPAANVRNVLGVDNGELRPSWKTALDATNPATLTVSTAAAPGTSLVFAHRDHAHAITSSSNPGAAASLLASDSSGFLTLAKLTATSVVSATLTYAGNISLDATGAGTTVVYVKNSGAGVANLDVDGALILAGTTTLNALVYTWPAAATAGYYLKVSGAGPYTLSWVNPVSDHTHTNDHARSHAMLSASDHTYTGGAALDIFGLSAANTLALLTPSANPGAAAALLKSDAGGGLELTGIIVNGSVQVNLGGGVAGYSDDGVTIKFNLSAATGALVICDGGDLTIYSDQVATIKFQVDGATGHIGAGQAANTYHLSLPADTAATGGLDFGGDVTLYRSAANVLKTDDSLYVALYGGFGAAPSASYSVNAALDINVAAGKGYMINGGATLGHVLMGDGTRYVDHTLVAGDISGLQLWTQSGSYLYPTTLTSLVGVGVNTPTATVHIAGASLEDETGWAGWYYWSGGMINTNAGTAFARMADIDLSPFAAAGNTHILQVKDTSGRIAWGYIDLADAAEALGSEMHTAASAWTIGASENNTAPYTGGWTPDPTIWASSNTDPNPGGSVYHLHCAWDASSSGRHTSYATTIGKVYKLVFYWKVLSGTARVRILDSGGNTKYSIYSTTGSYTGVTAYFTATTSTMRIATGSSGASEYYFDDMSLKEVTDCGATGVHIMSTEGGSTQDWAYVDPSFAPQSVAGFDVFGSATAASGPFLRTTLAGANSMVQDFEGIKLWSPAGAQTVQIAATGDVSYLNGGGYVGIGTTNPGALLEVYGTLNPRIKINSSAATAPGLQISQSGQTGWLLYQPGSTSDLRLFDNGNRVTFKSGGNVGIGTTSPAELLTLAITGKLGWEASAGVVDTNLYRSAANELKTDDSLYIALRLGVGVDPNTLYQAYVKGDTLTALYATTTGAATYAVRGDNTTGTAIYGSAAAAGYYGVVGYNTAGVGVYGVSDAAAYYGVHGYNTAGTAIFGSSSTAGYAGVKGQNTNGYGIWGVSGLGHAGYFEGAVYISGVVGIGIAKDALYGLKVTGGSSKALYVSGIAEITSNLGVGGQLSVTGTTFLGHCDISNSLDVTGDITVTGTVDGIDISLHQHHYRQVIEYNAGASHVTTSSWTAGATTGYTIPVVNSVGTQLWIKTATDAGGSGEAWTQMWIGSAPHYHDVEYIDTAHTGGPVAP